MDLCNLGWTRGANSLHCASLNCGIHFRECGDGRQVGWLQKGIRQNSGRNTLMGAATYNGRILLARSQASCLRPPVSGGKEWERVNVLFFGLWASQWYLAGYCGKLKDRWPRYGEVLSTQGPHFLLGSLKRATYQWWVEQQI